MIIDNTLEINNILEKDGLIIIRKFLKIIFEDKGELKLLSVLGKQDIVVNEKLSLQRKFTIPNSNFYSLISSLYHPLILTNIKRS